MKVSKAVLLGIVLCGCYLNAETYENHASNWGWNILQQDKEKPQNFEALPLEEKEQQVIEKMLHMLANSSDARLLLLQQKKLDKYMASLSNVHPLKFLSYIVLNPILRSDLQEVHRSFFKWRKFLELFRRRMTEEFYKDNLKLYVPGFAESLKVKEEIVDHFISHRDWEGLVKAVLY